MAQIIDGYCDFDNVTADMVARHNISLYGTGDYVLQVDECLEYDLVSNNEIHVKDGMFVIQGRRGCIKKGTTDICIIENGAQAVNRNDIIVIEYAKDETTMLETHTTKVIKGTAAEEAVDPEIVTGDINDGAILHQMPLYRVKIEGLNVVAVEQMFKMGSVAAETVDPMLATEEGFAADAKLTGDALSELSENLGGLEFAQDKSGNWGYRTAGADTVTPFKKGYENTPGSATAAQITKGYTAWVNGVKITGTRPVGATVLTGTWSPDWSNGNTLTKKVTFSTEFDSIPTITFEKETAVRPDWFSVSASSITTKTFVITAVNNSGGEWSLKITWTASDM